MSHPDVILIRDAILLLAKAVIVSSSDNDDDVKNKVLRDIENEEGKRAK